LAEFTGERVIPGQVDADLLNEHVARYAFAARMARGRRVLDAGCGSGYGAAELAREAREVLAIDISREAIDHARERYSSQRIRFQQASCLEIPGPDAGFDLVAAFELIEHLSDWRAFLREVRRVLSSDGQFLVSTPNRLYYAEARAQLGPNPFHVHEFEYGEFQSELESVFPRVALYLENHADAIVFSPARAAAGVESRIEQGSGNAEEAHFFLAVCSVAGETAVPGFVYVPRVANMLREREHHIGLLEGWLEKAKAELQDLMGQFRRQAAALDESNQWAGSLNEQLEQTGARVAALQDELAGEQMQARARIDELERHEAQLAKQLADACLELSQAVDYLHAAEHTVEERTAWAQRAQAEADALCQRVHLYQASRWVKMGGKLGLGPKLESIP